jgi:hypothetical protein
MYGTSICRHLLDCLMCLQAAEHLYRKLASACQPVPCLLVALHSRKASYTLLKTTDNCCLAF